MDYGYQISAQQLGAIEKIGVLAWGLIGDVFMRVPLLEALKKRFPDASITVIVDPAAAAVLEHHPACDRIVVFSHHKRGFKEYFSDYLPQALRLRREKYDLFINLYSGGSSPLLTRLINARIRLGFDHTRALRMANNLRVRTPSFCQHWTKALGAKLLPLGIDDAQIRRGSSFYVTDEARAYATQLLPEGKGYIGYNLGAGRAEKRWPVERFVALAQQVQQTYGLTPVVFTNPGMESLAEEFARGVGSDCIKLPLLSLDQVGAVMQRCQAMITGDTSLMHLAFGIKVPNMVLFTDTRPEIVEPEDCLHVACFIEDPEHINACGKPAGTVEIPVDYALEHVRQLFELIAKNH
jgi:ADP-heptose:LPS heptosyltransferase